MSHNPVDIILIVSHAPVEYWFGSQLLSIIFGAQLLSITYFGAQIIITVLIVISVENDFGAYAGA